MKAVNEIAIAVYFGSTIIYHTSYRGEEVKNFIPGDKLCLPYQNKCSIRDFIYHHDGKYLEECTKATLTLYNGDEEEKYFCKDLSQDELIWEKDI